MGGLAPKVAYVASAFPALSETFVLREVNELVRTGWDVRVFGLKRLKQAALHGDAERWKDRARVPALLSTALAGANFRQFIKQPATFVKLWVQGLAWHAGSANFLLRTPVSLLRAADVAAFLEREGIPHVHAHFATHPAMAALAAARLAGVSYSVTAHAHDLFMRQTGLEDRLRGAKFVVCISEFNRRFLLARYPDLDPEKLVVIPCGVNVEQIAFRPPPVPSGPLKVLCVAGLQEYKGQRVLLAAMAQMVKSQDVICTFVGTGPDREGLEEQTRELGLGEKVRFLGAQPQEEVARLLSEADVFVAPSVVARTGQMDGVPVALMEAMATGVPVVASDLSGIGELVINWETGMLVPPSDVQALAGAILGVSGDPALSLKLALNGRAWVERHYNVATNTARLAALFPQETAHAPAAMLAGVR